MPRNGPRGWCEPLVTAAIGAALVGLESTDIDRMVSRWFFDAASGTFPLRHEYLLDTVLHHWAKYAVVLIACLAVAGLVLTFIVPALRPQRRLLFFLALSLALAPATVTVLKLASDKPCPWDLAEFGGYLTYSRLLEPAPPGASPGRCFPAGHASTGFTLFAFYHAGRALRRRALAVAGLATGLAAGIVLGAARIAQGAHFLSHVLWSGLVCWLVISAVYRAVYRAGSVPGN